MLSIKVQNRDLMTMNDINNLKLTRKMILNKLVVVHI